MTRKLYWIQPFVMALSVGLIAGCEEDAAPGQVDDSLPGICCADGCSVSTEARCASEGGLFRLGDACEPNSCPMGEIGACCGVEGACETTEWNVCVSGGGVFVPGGNCLQGACEQPERGACCGTVLGECSVETELNCKLAGNKFKPNSPTCDPSPCVERGACCVDYSCRVRTEVQCDDEGAVFSVLQACSPDTCPPEPDAALPPDAAVPPDAAIADGGQDAAQPDAAQPDAAQPDAAQPDAAQPDAAQPDAAQPDAAQPDAAQPDAAMAMPDMSLPMADGALWDAAPPDAAPGMN